MLSVLSSLGDLLGSAKHRRWQPVRLAREEIVPLFHLSNAHMSIRFIVGSGQFSVAFSKTKCVGAVYVALWYTLL